MWQKYKIQYILKVHVIGITRLESQKDNMKWEKAIFEEILDGQLKENRSTVSWSSANPQQNKCKENHTNTQIKLLKSTEKKEQSEHSDIWRGDCLQKYNGSKVCIYLNKNFGRQKTMWVNIKEI